MSTFIQHTTKTQPKQEGWYNTDKGELYWFSVEKSWSCREDRVSEECPSFWYEQLPLNRLPDIDMKTASPARIENYVSRKYPKLCRVKCLEANHECVIDEFDMINDMGIVWFKSDIPGKMICVYNPAKGWAEKVFQPFDWGNEPIDFRNPKRYGTRKFSIAKPIEIHHKSNGTVDSKPSFAIVFHKEFEKELVIGEVSLSMLNNALIDLGYEIVKKP